MNQAIQFVDRYEYMPERKALKFDAIVSGLIISCFIQHNGIEVDNFFNVNRFDLEELATEQIENENYNSQGEIWLPSL